MNQIHIIMTSILLPNTAIFQDDNAPIYTAKTVQSWFNERQSIIKHPPWLAQSPDLNIIESIWDVLEQSEKQISTSNITEAIGGYFGRRMGQNSVGNYSGSAKD